MSEMERRKDRLEGMGYQFHARFDGELLVVRVAKGRRLVAVTGSWVPAVAWCNAVMDAWKDYR